VTTSLSFVVPARNEAAAIAGVVDGCLEIGRASGGPFEVIVVDDASTDATAALVADIATRRPEVRLVRHDTQHGIAQTSHDGLLAASHDIVCYLDGDGQFAPTDIPLLLAALDHADFVVGWRVHRAERGARRWGSFAYNRCTRWAGVPLHDVNCGFRVLRRRAFLAAGPLVDSRTSFYFAELTLRVIAAGFRVTEVVIAHHPRHGGAPSGASVAVVLGQFVDLARFVVTTRRRRPRAPGVSRD
jgi:dolichol-phosphate mannosyltransferase